MKQNNSFLCLKFPPVSVSEKLDADKGGIFSQDSKFTLILLQMYVIIIIQLYPPNTTSRHPTLPLSCTDAYKLLIEVLSRVGSSVAIIFQFECWVHCKDMSCLVLGLCPYSGHDQGRVLVKLQSLLSCVAIGCQTGCRGQVPDQLSGLINWVRNYFLKSMF